MLRESMVINEKLGRLQGKANAYANLGSVQGLRGDIPGARELLIKSRDLYARIGMPHMVTRVQGWLDRVVEASPDASSDPPGD